MAIFITHAALPAQCARTPTSVIDLIKKTRGLWEEAGGKLLHWFVVAGDYDYLFITEADDEKVMAEIAAKVSQRTHLKFRTYEGVTIEAFKEVVKRGTEPLDTEWIDSSDPLEVVGIAPDGGFFIHSSLHPFGTRGALDRARLGRIDCQERNSNLYFPMPWIRSELTWVLKHRVRRVPPSLLSRISVTLDDTVPTLLKREHLRTSTQHS